MTSPSIAEHRIDRRNLGVGQRIVRAAVAAGLLAVPFIGDQPLDLLSLLPLAAGYPGLTALVGYDPLRDRGPAAVRVAAPGAANDPSYGGRPLRRAA